MSAPAGASPALYSTWAYTIVDLQRRLEFVHNMSDAEGKQRHAGHPRDVHHVVTFEPVSDRVTRLTVHEQLPHRGAARPVEAGPRGVPRQARRDLRLALLTFRRAAKGRREPPAAGNRATRRPPGALWDRAMSGTPPRFTRCSRSSGARCRLLGLDLRVKRFGAPHSHRGPWC